MEGAPPILPPPPAIPSLYLEAAVYTEGALPPVDEAKVSMEALSGGGEEARGLLLGSGAEYLG